MSASLTWSKGSQIMFLGYTRGWCLVAKMPWSLSPPLKLFRGSAPMCPPSILFDSVILWLGNNPIRFWGRAWPLNVYKLVYIYLLFRNKGGYEILEKSPKSWICAVTRVLEVLEVLVIIGLSYFTCIIIANLFYRLKLLREIWSINNKCQDIQKCDAITCRVIALLSPYNLRTYGPDQPRLIFQGGCASASCCSTSEASSGSGTLGFVWPAVHPYPAPLSSTTPSERSQKISDSLR